MIRGFTLIETMVVIAILGIIGALAMPAFLPLRHRADSYGQADAVAAFLARAQGEAMTSRRCVRVYMQDGGTTLVMERLNVFDCGDSTENPSTAPRIDGSAIAANTLWLPLQRMKIGPTNATFVQAPTETSTTGSYPDSVGIEDEVRFRPTGRLFSSDQDLTDDDAVIRIRHPNLPAASEEIQILVESFGRICVGKRGQTIPDNAGDYQCP